jgi:hypothetical protein
MKYYDFDTPGALPSGRDDRVVSKVRLTLSPLHAHLRIWNRGAFAGEITVERDDWHAIVLLLGFYVDDCDRLSVEERLAP